MTTLDKCELCGMIYSLSGFFPAGEPVDPDLEYLCNITEEDWKKLVAFEPRVSNACAECTKAVAKNLKESTEKKE